MIDTDPQGKLLDIKRKKDEHVEFRVYGPPGTGKTTTLSNWINQAAQKYGSNSVIVASYTKTGAMELAGRDLQVHQDQVGTVHAHCYRALGQPEVCEVYKHIKEWNDHVAGIDDAYMLSEGQKDTDDPYAGNNSGATDGDRMLSRYNLLRARMIPPEHFMRDEVSRFAELWENWKHETNMIDFTDMISLAYQNIDVAPGNPMIGFIDEIQDSSLLELSLIRKWAKAMKYVVLGGDDDQAIFSWRGASPEAFLNPPLDARYKRILDQSYRIPQSVHALSQNWIKQITVREPKEYKPQNRVGEVRRIQARFAYISEVESMLEDVEQYLCRTTESGRPWRVAFLTSCNYQLNTLKSVLRATGQIFFNPLRPNRGDWNPLGKRSTADKIVAFAGPQLRADVPEPDNDENCWRLRKLAHDDKYMQKWLEKSLWTKTELNKWLEVAKTSTFLKAGSLTTLSQSFKNEITGRDLLPHFKEIDDLILAGHGMLSWLRKRIKANYENHITYLFDIIAKHGLKGFQDLKPQIIIGTIHSYKGGEVEVVYLCPDLSPQGMQTYDNEPDEIVRQFYVGMTRCKESLVLCSPAGNMSVRI